MSYNGPKKDFEPLPEGDYSLRMKNCSTSATANGGTMVKAAFEVIKNDDFKNRLVFENFIIAHSNPKAALIGQERLSKFLKAVGEEGGFEALGMDASKLDNYTELPFVGTVGVKEPETYTDRKTGEQKVSKPRNTLKAFKKR